MLYTVETRYKRVGNLWCGTAKITGPRGVRHVSVTLPIPPGADIKVSGIFDDIGSAVSSLTKNKVVKKLGGMVKNVIKSDITKAAVAGLAVAFPPVGVPAAAAYATAATVVNYAEKAGSYATAAKAAAGALARNPAAAAKMGVNAKTLANVQAKARAGMQAKKVIAETITRHQKGDTQATKFLKTLNVAKKANTKLNAISKVVKVGRQSKGILVLPSGELLKGSFGTAGLTRV